MDPLLCIKIKNPIMIPEVKTIFDRSSIITHLYTNKTNPYTRKPLTEEELDHYNDLDEVKQQIKQFIEKINDFEKNYKNV
jgi:ubiquitin conjugation factor E4 B